MKKQFLLLIGAVFAAVNTLQAGVSQQTLDNLNTAFQGESNAANRYSIFAQAADKAGEGYVAHLFRAAAKAETIHRDTHKRTILELGGKINNFKLEDVNPGTPAENLRGAIKGESYERDTMYPEFLAQAKKDGAKAAIRIFVYAQKAELEHAKLYQNALDNLGKNTDTTFYVCSVCGYTTTEKPAKYCVSCRESADVYEIVK
jgi:rubrerythrin